MNPADNRNLRLLQRRLAMEARVDAFVAFALLVGLAVLGIIIEAL